MKTVGKGVAINFKFAPILTAEERKIITEE